MKNIFTQHWPFRTRKPRLSVVLVCHNMRREVPRTLRSLSAEYQRNVTADDYEVLVIDNGSDVPFDPDSITAMGANFQYHYLDDPPPSPAYALNYGVSLAKGDIVCTMIDGACLVTPGVISTAMQAFDALTDPLVMTRYFYLGPGKQNETIQTGYNQEFEDRLLAGIDWPHDGYRLFEIATAFMGGACQGNWFRPVWESNCTFLQRSTFHRLGGFDERFDKPAGGLVNHDMLVRAATLDSVEVVQLLGEGTFHQLHGGTTTNVPVVKQQAVVSEYRDQYEQLRRQQLQFPTDRNQLYFFGKMHTRQAIEMQHSIDKITSQPAMQQSA